ncbi:hypothetical protein ISCGN_011655 [Ixodes scapularis]
MEVKIKKRKKRKKSSQRSCNAVEADNARDREARSDYSAASCHDRHLGHSPVQARIGSCETELAPVTLGATTFQLTRQRAKREYSLAAISVCVIAERVLTASFHSSFATCIPHHQDYRS